MKRTFKSKLADANNLLNKINDDLALEKESYLLGLYNGLELGLAIFEEREAKYKDAPLKKKFRPIKKILMLFNLFNKNSIVKKS